jgi:1A family penicillin-binding protein
MKKLLQVLNKGSKFAKYHYKIIRTTPSKQLFRIYKKQLLYALVTILGILIFIPIFTYLYFLQDIKDKNTIVNTNDTGLTLLDRDGHPFFTFYQPKQIKYIPLTQIPLSIQQAVIAQEDKNFYSNPGVSFRGMLRALYADVTAGHIVQGGSTITQELVKNALLNSNQSFLRKFQEVILAYELSQKYNKQDILEMYLNSVYFGEGAFGIENAAQTYFGKDAKDLTLSESTILAGLLPAPSYLSPLSNDPQRALTHQRLVLQQMVSDQFITQDQANQTANIPITYHPAKQDLNTLAPHFAIYVKDQLIQKYGEENVIRSGYIVKTTLNSIWQTYAETVVHNQLQYLKYNKASNGAAVAIDPKTGQILTMVGSEDWNNPDFGKANMATTPRQPGSSFKPIVYAYALEHHLITPASILNDSKTTFPGNYEPHDYDLRYRGPVTVRRALANSLNIPAVQVMNEVGVQNTLATAQDFGITTLTDPTKYGLSLVLGAGEVPLLQMTDAYAVFADNGTYNPPVSILQITDKRGNTIEKYQENPKTVLDEGTAFLISSILSDNNARAEEFDGALTISHPAAVKTGTTENFHDALTIGYTPSLVVGIWVGNNDNTPMDNIAGSLGAAPIWRLLMQNFLASTPIETFKPPSSILSVDVCPYRGLNNTNFATASAIREFFIQDTQPKNGCMIVTPTLSKTSPTPTPPQQPTTTQAPANTPTITTMPTITQSIATPINTATPTVPSPTSSINTPTIKISLP